MICLFVIFAISHFGFECSSLIGSGYASSGHCLSFISQIKCICTEVAICDSVNDLENVFRLC